MRGRARAASISWGHRSLVFVFLAVTAVPALARPFAVTTEITLRHGNWYPLPAEEMQAAAADTALAEISRSGVVRLLEAESATAERDGTLSLEISLIGPAESAKLTMALNLKDKPTTISTASISVRGLDYQGIFAAFEHIGHAAAQRLNDKLEARLLPLLLKPEPDATVDDPAVRAAYDKAESLKRQYQYNESRILFEQIVAATGPGAERLRRLAQDELRYGLTLFEARQGMVAMGRIGNEPGKVFQLMRRVENLLRQVVAENTGSFERTQEAQRYLDEVLVARNAYNNVLSATALSKMSNIRILLMQELNMTGKCPSEATLRELMQNVRVRLVLKQVEALEGKVVYTFADEALGREPALICEGFDVRLDRSGIAARGTW